MNLYLLQEFIAGQLGNARKELDPMDGAAESTLQSATFESQGQSIPAQAARRSWFLAAGGVLGAIAASSCCILPLVLFSVGISGAWVGNLVQLAPYQPYFIAVTVACLGYGYWLVYRFYRSSRIACANGEACTRPLPIRLVTIALVLATALVVAAFSFNSVAPFFLS